MPYINILHSDDPSWHIFADSILLNTFEGLVELLIAMTNLNKSYSFLLIPENIMFFSLSPMSDFLNSCVGTLSLIM